MAKPIMIQGTMSNAGKSLLTAGLCRIFKQDGYSVAPFKSQNMSLNSFITADGLEMGRAQVVQAEAAGIAPTVSMNPILLKPTTDMGSQVIVNGEVRGNMRAAEYFRYKRQLVPEIFSAYSTLANKHDIIVVEGAGSPAEINLKNEDIVNMGLAELIDSPVLLAGDIDRGGVFAQLYGTVMLLPEHERRRIKGLIINKFRGDTSILKPGLKMIEELVKIPVVGTVPMMSVDIDDEDSLSDRLVCETVPKPIDIAVIRFPYLSNFTDSAPFEQLESVSLRYVKSASQLGSPDLIILPGTKSTMADLRWLRQNGLEGLILRAAANDIPIFGICGGYQMLGMSLSDPDRVEGGGDMAGMKLLDIQTIFKTQKTRKQVCGKINTVGGIFAELSGAEYNGYEIHMGVGGNGKPVFNNRNIYGSYIHGIFDKAEISSGIINALAKEKGILPENVTQSREEYKQQQYDKLACELRAALDMPKIYAVLNREDD